MKSKSEINEAQQTLKINSGKSASLFERFNKKNREFATKLHNSGIAYPPFDILDGLNTSYSLANLIASAKYANTDILPSDALHDWALTPGGIEIAAFESIFLMTYAYVAGSYKDEDPNDLIRFMVLSWPYARNVFKALKNAYKGIRSTFLIAHLLGTPSLNFCLLPVGLGIGVLSSLNRIGMLAMVEGRKVMMKNNKLALAEIKQLGFLSPVDKEKYLQIIKTNSQYEHTRVLALFGAAYGGLVDSLYLYLGVFALCAMTIHAVIAMTVLCGLYTAFCVAARTYEEYNYQRDLLITHAEIELELYDKDNRADMQDKYDVLKLLNKQIKQAEYQKENLQQDDKDSKILEEIKRLDEKIISLNVSRQDLAKNVDDKLSTYIKLRNKLASLQILSNVSAALTGIKHALSAYSALNSVVFFVATITALAGGAFPPALLIACISLGMLFLAFFTTISLINNHNHRIAQETAEQPLMDLKELLEKGQHPKIDVRKSIDLGVKVEPSPPSSVNEWAEVLRSWFSGLGKGFKTIDYPFNFLQVPDEQGHYHDSHGMIGISIISSIIYAVALAARAYVKGFGKPKPGDNVELPAVPGEKPPPVSPIDSLALSIPNNDEKGFCVKPGKKASIPDLTLVTVSTRVSQQPATPKSLQRALNQELLIRVSSLPNFFQETKNRKKQKPGQHGVTWRRNSEDALDTAEELVENKVLPALNINPLSTVPGLI